MRAIVFAFASLLIVGCNNNDQATDGGADAAPDLTSAGPDLRPPPSGIGASCTSAGGFDQGSCNAGQICIPDGQFGFTDGYCTAQCDASNPCPGDSKCVDVGSQAGSFCFVTCSGDTDCRADYTCSPMNQVCVPKNPGGGGGEVTPGTAPDGGACVVPPTTAPTPLFGTDQRVSTGNANELDAETSVGIDGPGKRVVVSWINAGAGSSFIGVNSSSNDGVSFATPFKLPTAEQAMNVDKNNAQSDPVVAVDTDGTFYITWIGFDGDAQGNISNMNVYVARSKDGGTTFPDLYVATPPGEWSAGGFLDKPWIAVDPVSHAVYVTYDRQGQGSATVDIRMVRSADKGMTWSAPATISDSNNRPNVDRNLAQVQVGAGGLPMVAWVEVGANQLGSTDNQVYLQRFNNDGSRNGSNVLVTGGSDSPTFEDPSLAIDGSLVYVGFISGMSTGGWDVRVAASLDGGATFTPSVKVNDDPTCATHFHHQIVVTDDHVLHAFFYDNRYLTGNLWHASSTAAATGRALAFGVNKIVNNQPFMFTTSRSAGNWLGDYIGAVSAGSELYVSWSDPRVSNLSHIYFVKGTAP